MFNAHPAGHPLNAWELKVLEGTHGTDPKVLRRGPVWLEKNTKNWGRPPGSKAKAKQTWDKIPE